MLSQLFFLYLNFHLRGATVVVEPSLLQQVKGNGLGFIFPVSVEFSCCPAALNLLPTYIYTPEYVSEGRGKGLCWAPSWLL